MAYNNNGPNGHLFYVGGDLMTRRSMLPIIMLPDGDLPSIIGCYDDTEKTNCCSSVHSESPLEVFWLHLTVQWSADVRRCNKARWYLRNCNDQGRTSIKACTDKRHSMGLLPIKQNCRLRMRRERFPRHRIQRKPVVTDPGMHHGTCVTHMPWCMSGSLTRGGGENVPGIPGACATRNFTYLVRGPYIRRHRQT